MKRQLVEAVEDMVTGVDVIDGKVRIDDYVADHDPVAIEISQADSDGVIASQQNLTVGGSAHRRDGVGFRLNSSVYRPAIVRRLFAAHRHCADFQYKRQKQTADAVRADSRASGLAVPGRWIRLAEGDDIRCIRIEQVSGSPVWGNVGAFNGHWRLIHESPRRAASRECQHQENDQYATAVARHESLLVFRCLGYVR